MSRNQMPPRRNLTPQKMGPSQLDRIEAGQARIEAKFDALLDALADDENDGLNCDLDGNPLEGGERDEGKSLD